MSNYAKINPQGEKNRIAALPKGENHWNFDKNPSVKAIHKWINRHFGKADHCENENCEGKSNWFEWALLRGCEYARDIKVFKQLCRSCHTKYDMTDERKANIVAGIFKTWDKRKKYGKSKSKNARISRGDKFQVSV